MPYYKGYCPELKREHIVSKKELAPNLYGLLECVYAQECKYFKENNKCALVKQKQ